MRVELSKLHADLGATMIYVTHDQVEAMTMADRIVVLRDGRIEQAGSPLELYNNPANKFVAGFIGSPKMNFIAAKVAKQDATMKTFALHCGGTVDLPVARSTASPGQDMTIGIRPEHIEIANTGLPLTISLAEQLGGNTVLHGALGANQPLVVQLVGQSRIARGDVVHVRLPPETCHVFDA